MRAFFIRGRNILIRISSSACLIGTVIHYVYITRDIYAPFALTLYTLWSRPIYFYKRDIIIEKEFQRWIMKYIKCFSYPLPFYATQIICPFLNSRNSANHDKVNGLSGNSRIRRLFLYYRISFIFMFDIYPQEHQKQKEYRKASTLL